MAHACVAGPVLWARPLCGGTRLASSAGMVGSLASCWRDAETGAARLLGTSHVMGDAGDPVWQPGPCDKEGCTCNRIGIVTRSSCDVIELAGHRYYVDCAAASLDEDVPIDGLGVRGVARTRRGARVYSRGAASGSHAGVVAEEHHVENVQRATGALMAPNQLLIRGIGGPFAVAGDSGALVVDEEERVVGLVWGASPSGEAVASHIAPVLHALHLEVPR